MSSITSRILPQTEGMGGRVFVIFLLFLLGLFLFARMGTMGLAAIVVIPVAILLMYVSYKFSMLGFWGLFITNYFIMGLGRYFYIPVQITLIMELFEVLVLISILLDYKNIRASYLGNTMGLMLGIWIVYLIIQIFNETCSLPFSMGEWFIKFNQLALNLYIVYAITTLSVNTPERITKFLKLWAVLSLLAVFWAWRQKTFGFDDAEKIWLAQGGASTHIIAGAIRYFSFYSDAANFGCSIGAAATAFMVLALTAKTKFDKIFYGVTFLACVYGLFASGTRAALFVFIVGVSIYIVLSKSIKIAMPVLTAGTIFICILAFTDIGNNNNMIRRMRTAFDPNDPSKGVRDVNKEALRKYMRDAPFGLGISMDPFKIPANNKYKIVSQTASDSSYVYLWEYTGIVGEVLFALVNVIILFGGCWIVMFRIKNKALCGIGAAFCCAFGAINVGGYVNNILTQYPNLILYYGGMAICYVLPRIEKDYQLYEDQVMAKIEEHKRIKEEKKLASRV